MVYSNIVDNPSHLEYDISAGYQPLHSVHWVAKTMEWSGITGKVKFTGSSWY